MTTAPDTTTPGEELAALTIYTLIALFAAGLAAPWLIRGFA